MRYPEWDSDVAAGAIALAVGALFAGGALPRWVVRVRTALSAPLPANVITTALCAAPTPFRAFRAFRSEPANV
jgi:hypothetical protein